MNTAEPQSIEQLKEWYLRLDKQKTVAETQAQAAAQQLEQLQAAARKEYGTDDLEQLEALLEKMKAENEEKRAAYQATLTSIDLELAAVEREFAASKENSPGAK
ncbi:MAG: hypothetical protein SFX18_12750 [Pirellulales bacterium]|nr:hypothetical protein [Pirellulales bacterium]